MLSSIINNNSKNENNLENMNKTKNTKMIPICLNLLKNLLYFLMKLLKI